MRSALSAALCCLLGSTVARAEPPNKLLELTYARGAGTSGCPAEAALHDAVLRQIGYDPFRPQAPHRLTAIIMATPTRHGRVLVAKLQIRDAASHVVWEDDSLDTPGGCAVLVMAMGLKLARWFDPEPAPAVAEAQPAPPPERPPPPIVAPISRPTPPPQAPAPPKIEMRLGVDALVNIGITPSPSIGAGPIFELRPLRSFSIELGLRAAWTPVASLVRDIPIRSVYLSGTAAPCARVAFFSGCAVLEAGSLRSQSESGVRVTTLNPAVIAVGTRARAEWSAAKRLSLNGFFELKAVPTVTRLWIDDGHEAWKTPPVFFSLGFGVTMRP